VIKAIIFDFFGIFYTDLFWTWLEKKLPDLEEKREILSQINQEFDKNQVDEEEFLKSLSEVVSVPADKIVSEMDEGATFNYSLVGLLSELKKNYKLGLLTNARSEWIRKIMEKYDFEKYFDSIIISSEVGHVKPEPEIFEEIIKLLGVSKSEALFVDDRIRNVAAAQELGIKSIIYVSNEKLMTDLKKQALI